MLRKEFNEVLRQSLFFVVLTLLVPFFLDLTLADKRVSYFETFFLLFQFGLLFFVLFLGNSLFLWDRKQRAVDYLFSLPYSKYRLLGIKVLPRLAAAAVFYLLYLQMYRTGGHQVAVMSFFSFTYIYFCLFILALSFSVSMENYVLMAVVTLLAMTAFLGIIYLIPTLLSQLLYGTDIRLTLQTLLLLRVGSGKLLLSFIGIIMGLLFPFIAAFIFTFKKIGIHPVNRFNRRYFKIFFPLLAAGVIFASLIVSSMFTPGYKIYYLTQGHRLVEWDSLSVRVYDENNVEEITYAPFRRYRPLLIETENSLYYMEYNFLEDSTYFIRLNLKPLSVEKFYKLEGRNRRGFTGPWLFKNTIAIVKGYPKDPDKELHLIDMNTTEVKKITLPQKSIGYVQLFGADVKDGKRFWLIDREWKSRHSLYRLWENGEKEALGTSQRLPCYINGVMITYSKDTATLRELIPRGREHARRVKTITVGEGFIFQSYRLYNLRNPTLKETIGLIVDHNNKSRRYYMLDMENLELREIKVINDKIAQSTHRDPELKYHVLQFTPDEYYYIEYKWKNGYVDHRRIYAVDNDELTLLKEFPPLGEHAETFYSPGGIIIREPGKVSVYAFPDLRELTFKIKN